MDDAEQQELSRSCRTASWSGPRSGPGPRHPEQFDDQLRHLGVGHVKEPEEALRLLVLEFLLAFPGKGGAISTRLTCLTVTSASTKAATNLMRARCRGRFSDGVCWSERVSLMVRFPVSFGHLKVSSHDELNLCHHCVYPFSHCTKGGG